VDDEGGKFHDEAGGLAFFIYTEADDAPSTAAFLIPLFTTAQKVEHHEHPS